jgi:hypothetical protein
MEDMPEFIICAIMDGSSAGTQGQDDQGYPADLIYRQPGLLCTPRNLAQSSKCLGKNIFWYQGYL